MLYTAIDRHKLLIIIRSKNMKKYIAIILAAVLVASVAVFGGCSKGTGGGETTTAAGETTEAVTEAETEAETQQDVPEVAGETQSWGKISSVLVPEGLTFAKGAYGDETDENAVTISDEAQPLYHYYLINVMTPEEIQDSINASKEMNEEYGIEDVAEFKEGNNTFSGITYGEEGTFKVYILSMSAGDKSASVTISVPQGTDITSDEVRAVLASIELA